MLIPLSRTKISKLKNISGDELHLRGNAGKNKKSGIMGVLRSSWFEDMLEVLMRKSEIQNFRFSSPPVAEIMENKGFAHN